MAAFTIDDRDLSVLKDQVVIVTGREFSSTLSRQTDTIQELRLESA